LPIDRVMKSPFLSTALVLPLTLCSMWAAPIEKDALQAKFRKRFVVVNDKGLMAASCDSSSGAGIGVLTNVVTSVRNIEIKRGTRCPVQPLQMGEVLKVEDASFHFGNLILETTSVSPHSVTRGAGAFAHEITAQAKAYVWFRAGKDGKDFAAADALAAHWFTPFDTATDAAKIGNTASGVFVKEVKAGMSFAEVESALGVPVTRVDLGAKVLYKFKDMIVEFQNGKVADVR